MYTLTVPTGGGKTLASLRFALHHAKEYSMDRIIYVIPYTSIIDQNARIAREILEPAGVEPGSVVLEHHSNLTPEKDTWQNKTLSQNWDAPVIYTTSVQLLEALFAAGTRDVRRLHRLANAVIVFDEIQTMPIRCVHLFSNAMNFLVAHVKSTVVLCTATQPLLQKVDATKGAIQLSTEPSEMMPDVAGLFEALQRVEVIDQRKPEGWSVEEIAALAVQEQETSCSCLVIVNTKKMALALYEQCGGARNPHLFHLSTNMCPAHRKAKLDNILSRLEPGKEEPTMCISTQLIEAGVDVDFGCVIRSAAGLDSIAQAAGRCNRNARRAKARVYVVNPTDEYLGKLPDISIGKQAYERFAWEYANEPDAFDKNPLGEKALERFFTYYFFDRRGEMAYTVKPPTFEREDTLLNILSFNGKAVEESGRVNKNKTDLILRQSFMSAAQAFKAIDTAAQGVVVPYGPKGVGLINDLCAADEPKKQYPLLRKAQQYTVNVFPNVLEKLQKSGAVHEVQEGTGILYLDKHYYDEATGLVETPTGTMDTLMT
jgi:CRISPR-associated endonuclease/helicase Cas3